MPSGIALLRALLLSFLLFGALGSAATALADMPPESPYGYESDFERGERIGRVLGFLCCPCCLLVLGAGGAGAAVLVIRSRSKPQGQSGPQ